MTQIYFEECGCSCHGEGGQVKAMHIVPCCSTCTLCGKRIKTSFEKAHFQRMHKRKVDEMLKNKPGPVVLNMGGGCNGL